MKTLSLILPCYNEAKSLPQLVKRALSCAESRQIPPEQFQLILVENGSRDNSLQVMEEIKNQERGKYIQIVKVSPNEGYGNGIYQGLLAAKSDFVGWSHADEQCDPDDVFRAWDVLQQEETPTLVKGRRYGRKFSDRFVSKVFEIVAIVLLGLNLKEINAQPKLFPKELISDLKRPPKDFAFDLYTLFQAKKNKYHIKEIDVHFAPRAHGESNWSSSFRSKFRTVKRMIEFMFQMKKQETRSL